MGAGRRALVAVVAATAIDIVLFFYLTSRGDFLGEVITGAIWGAMIIISYTAWWLGGRR